MKNMGQAGLEYLMTYGWALVLIVTIVGALVFVISPSTETANFSSNEPTRIMVKGGSISGNSVEVLLQNISGGNITVSEATLDGTVFQYSPVCLNDRPIRASDNCSGNPVISSSIPLEISSGEEMYFTGITYSGTGIGSILISYTDFSGLSRSALIKGGYGGGFSEAVGLKAIAESCSTGSECESGSCEDRICCGSACTACESCDLAGTEGTCIGDALNDGNPCGYPCWECVDGVCDSTYNYYYYTDATAFGCDETIWPGTSEGCRYCARSKCMVYDDGLQHGCPAGAVCGTGGSCSECAVDSDCDACFSCESGTCTPQTADGAAATALGCSAGDEGCRKCDAGNCTYYTSGQQDCGQCQTCNTSGRCRYCTTGDLVDCGYFANPPVCTSWNTEGNWAIGALCDIDTSAYIDTCAGTNHDLWQELSGLVPGANYVVKWMSVCWGSGNLEVILGGNSSGALSSSDFDDEFPYVAVSMTAGSQDNKLIVRALDPCSATEIEDISVVPCSC